MCPLPPSRFSSTTLLFLRLSETQRKYTRWDRYHHVCTSFWWTYTYRWQTCTERLGEFVSCSPNRKHQRCTHLWPYQASIVQSKAHTCPIVQPPFQRRAMPLFRCIHWRLFYSGATEVS